MKEKETVQSLDRAFGVLNIFTFERPELTLSEIASAVSLPMSTASRLLTSLLQVGALRKDGKTYSLGYKLFHLGSIAALQFDMGTIVEPMMKELADLTGERVTLSVLSDKQRVCIKLIKSKKLVDQQITVGEPQPLYAGSVGKVLLAYQSDDYIEEYFHSVALEPMTPNTITDINLLKRDFIKIRADGYCFSQGERISHAYSASAPIFNIDGKIAACLSIAGIRLEDDPPIDPDYLTNLVCNVAKKASMEQGYIKYNATH